MLEVFLKKYGWVANLVLLAAAAWLLARTVNTAVGAAITPPKPECSLSTTTTICGSSAGAKAANQAWSRWK